jgi:hypothetical protein
MTVMKGESANWCREPDARAVEAVPSFVPASAGKSVWGMIGVNIIGEIRRAYLDQQAMRLRAGRGAVRHHSRHQKQIRGHVPQHCLSADPRGDALVQFEVAWRPNAKDPAIVRFVAFMRDEAW